MNEAPIKVLLIDDDPDFVRLTAERLTSSKEPAFHFESALDLTSGLRRLSQGGIDCLLLDLKLKETDGLDTLKQVLSRTRDIPIVVLTGEYGESLGPETLKLGAQDYFLKGAIEPQGLIRSIRYAIERKRQARELKTAHEELKRAHSEIKRLLALIPSILISVGPDNKITHFNSVAERVLGVHFRDAIGRPISSFGIEWDHQRFLQAIQEARVRQFPIRLEDVSFTRPDGAQGLLGFTINPVKAEDIDRGTVLLFGADITHRRQVESRIGAQTGDLK